MAMEPRDALAAHESQANIRSTRLSGSTEYSITGALNSVLETIGYLFVQWHPYGYGTKVKHMEMLSDGTYGAIVTRSNSCD
jgi:hypothetical protein